jgi:serine/threonine-protein kinase
MRRLDERRVALPVDLVYAYRVTAPTLEAFRFTKCDKDGRLLEGRYRIVGFLGEGSTADVFLAADETNQQLVVVKWLTESAARDRQIRARFLLGAGAALSVRHPSVRRVFTIEDAGPEPPYIVMEALPGEPLSDYLERVGPVPQAFALELARQIASGLAAAHAAGIVHRDLKPDNLFLVQLPGAAPSVKLIDFGFAKDTRADPDAGPSSVNLVLGTAQYMAPEQVLAEPVDARTDIYGFGVVLFRILTGHLPFDVDPGVDLFGHQLLSAMPPPSWLVEELEPGLEQIVLGCTRKHPENRYQSMQAVLADLERVANGAPVSALPRAREPDVFKPRNTSAREAAEALAAHFGKEPPPPATVRYDGERIDLRRER